MKNLARLLGLTSESPENAKEAKDQTNIAKNIDNKQDDSSLSIVESGMSEGNIQYVQITEIVPNPFQPRKIFSEESLQELASSIEEYGIIQPLIVRLIPDGFELVAGERRLRASKLVGLSQVPVIIKEFTDKEMAELAMIENLQREDLHFLEEAEGFQQLITSFAFTQEELAKRMGKNQSTIANKLRLLKLIPEVRGVIAKEKLTERHARSLLKLEDSRLQLEVLEMISEKKLNVRETEELIEEFLEDIAKQVEAKNTPKRNVVKVIRDVRIFINTINNVVGEMKKTGLKIKVKQEQDEEFIHINLRIPKKK
ncbi:nucleoid occlusion protein [Pelosinus propionicus]|uniref:ParB family protein n=1 Tax=Pelosinus propionicus DSM 13327 TaxID=1123291 RepID=A0A1I4KYA3_9FIRM|nr:nucleoid occlusion protein [Pelosinus propionicus]SFL83509.1 ParB family protein [Pelosinus propionicus DSM 13327]